LHDPYRAEIPHNRKYHIRRKEEKTEGSRGNYHIKNKKRETTELSLLYFELNEIFYEERDIR
jgi:hypothetical protein